MLLLRAGKVMPKGTHLAVGKIFHEHRNIQQREKGVIENRWSQLMITAFTAEQLSPCKTARHSLCHVRNPREDQDFVVFWHTKQWGCYWVTEGPQYPSLPLVLVNISVSCRFQTWASYQEIIMLEACWLRINSSPGANGVYLLEFSTLLMPRRGNAPVKSCNINQILLGLCVYHWSIWP